MPDDALTQALNNLNQGIKNFSSASIVSSPFPTYEGNSDPNSFKTFLRNWYRTANALGYDEELACRRLPLSLRGQALSVYETIADEKKKKWNELCQEICNRMYTAKCLPKQRSALNRRVQRDAESAYEYGMCIRDLVQLSYPGGKYTEAQLKDLEISHFITGLRPEVKEILSRMEDLDTLEKAMERASKEEQLQNDLKADRVFQERIVASVHMDERQRALERKIDELEARYRDFDEVADRFEDLTVSAIDASPPSNPRYPRHDGRGYFSGISERYNNFTNRLSRIPERYRNFTRRFSEGPRFFNRFREQPRVTFSRDQPDFRRSFRENRPSEGNRRYEPRENRPFEPRNGRPFDSNRDSIRERAPTPFRPPPQDSNRQRPPMQRRRKPGPYKINSVHLASDPPQLERIEERSASAPPPNALRLGSTYVPLLVIVSLLCTVASAHQTYQICLDSNNAGYLMAPPKPQDCTPPPVDRVKKAEIEIFVPRLIPQLFTAYLCVNETRHVCTYSVFGITQQTWYPQQTLEAVTQNECWDMVKYGKLHNETLLTQVSEDLWETKSELKAENAVFGEKCTSVSDYRVRKGTIGSLHGESMTSDLINLAGCTTKQMYCSKDHGIAVWDSYDPRISCSHDSAGTFEALVTHSHILVEEIQSAFIFSRRKLPASLLGCLPPPLYAMENEVVIRIISSKPASPPRTKRDVDPPRYQKIEYEDEHGDVHVGYAFVDPADPPATYDLEYTAAPGSIIIDFDGTEELSTPSVRTTTLASYEDIEYSEDYAVEPEPNEAATRQKRMTHERYVDPRDPTTTLTPIKYREIAAMAPDGNLRIAYKAINPTAEGTEKKFRWHPPHGAMVENMQGQEYLLTTPRGYHAQTLAPDLAELLVGKSDTQKLRMKFALLSPKVNSSGNSSGTRAPLVKITETVPQAIDSRTTSPTPSDEAATSTSRTTTPEPVWRREDTTKSRPTTTPSPTAPPRKQSTARSQMDNALNTRIQFAADKLQLSMQQDYRQLWRSICGIHNENIRIKNALMKMDPTTAVRLYLNREDLVAHYAGEVLAVTACTQVQPSVIYWNHTVNNICYRQTPVLVNETLLFVQTGTRELTKNAEVVPCNKRPTAIYQNATGYWTSENGPVNVASLSRHVMFKHQRQSIDLKAPGIFQSDLSQIATSVSLLSSYANRINRVETTLRRMTTNSFSPKETGKAVAEYAEDAAHTLANKTVETTGWIQGTFTSVTDTIKAWQNIVKAILMLVLLVIGATACVYGYCWCRALLPQNAARSYEYEMAPINAVHMDYDDEVQQAPYRDPVEQPAPPYHPGNFKLLNFYPEIYNVTVPEVNATQLYIPVNLSGFPARALFDSGSSVTYARASIVQAAGVPIQPTSVPHGRAANNTQIRFLGTAGVILTMGNTTLRTTILVSEDSMCPTDIILGLDTMQLLNQPITLNFRENKISLLNDELKFINAILDDAEAEPTPLKVRVARTTVLEPRTDSIIAAKVDADSPVTGTYLTEEVPHKYGFLRVGSIFVQPDISGFVPIRVLNPGMSKIKVYANSCLALLVAATEMFVSATGNAYHRVAAVQGIDYRDQGYAAPEARWEDKLPPLPSGKPQKPISEKLNLEGTILSPEAQELLKQVVNKRHKAFVKEDGVIGLYTGPIQFRIDLKPDAVPCQSRPYRAPLALRGEIERQIEDMLKQKVIQPSTSQFSSPVVMVRKGHGDKQAWRFAVDYRKLNSITVPITSYLPLVSDILDLAAGKKVYSSMDFQSGFWQIPVAPEHRERTAFSTHLGLFEYLRLPFGVRNGPAVFQRVMDHMRREITAAIFTYIDDVIICSLDELQHIKDIDQLLEVIIKYGMKVGIHKCHWGMAEVKFVGFLVGGEGLRIDPYNTDLVRKFRVPQNLSEVRSFVGAVSFFRRFIPNFATLMKPLYDLTKKDRGFVWTPECQKSFEGAIEKLTKAPIIGNARLGHPFEIHTDASAIAIASVLLQKDEEDRLRVISYNSRTLNPHEVRYPSIELEGLAVVYALREYEPYILGSGPVTIITDNSCLCALTKSQKLSGRLLKYQMIIQSYDVIIQHRPGKQNALCDYMSRYCHPLKDDNNKKADSAAVNALHLEAHLTPTISFDRVKKEQKAVPEYRQMYDGLRFGVWPTRPEYERIVRDNARHFAVRDGALYYRAPSDDDDVPRLLIPYALRVPLIKEFHESPLVGAHLGQRKVVAKMAKRVFWPSMTTDIRSVIRSCHFCQRKKTIGTQVSTEPIHPIRAPRYPFERVHTDITGPLPLTERGNRYILVTHDALTKWHVATAMPDQKATTVSKAFMEHVICIYGVPATVCTDNGRQFAGKIFTDLAKLFGFSHVTTTPYHPQANGAVERFNRSLATMISAYANEAGTNWDEFVSLTVFASNNSINTTTNQTPFYLLYFREARLPTDLALHIEPQRVTEQGTMYLQDMSRGIRQAWDIASKAITDAQSTQKANADEHNRAREHQLEPLQLVLKYRDQPPEGAPTKFFLRWEGPYRIVAIRRPNAMIKELREDAAPFAVHMDKLKPYHEAATLPLRPKELRGVPRTTDGPIPNTAAHDSGLTETLLLRVPPRQLPPPQVPLGPHREPRDRHIEQEAPDDDPQHQHAPQHHGQPQEPQVRRSERLWQKRNRHRTNAVVFEQSSSDGSSSSDYETWTTDDDSDYCARCDSATCAIKRVQKTSNLLALAIVLVLLPQPTAAHLTDTCDQAVHMDYLIALTLVFISTVVLTITYLLTAHASPGIVEPDKDISCQPTQSSLEGTPLNALPYVSILTHPDILPDILGFTTVRDVIHTMLVSASMRDMVAANEKYLPGSKCSYCQKRIHNTYDCYIFSAEYAKEIEEWVNRTSWAYTSWKIYIPPPPRKNRRHTRSQNRFKRRHRNGRCGKCASGWGLFTHLAICEMHHEVVDEPVEEKLAKATRLERTLRSIELDLIDLESCWDIATLFGELTTSLREVAQPPKNVHNVPCKCCDVTAKDKYQRVQDWITAYQQHCGRLYQVNPITPDDWEPWHGLDYWYEQDDGHLEPDTRSVPAEDNHGRERTNANT